MSVVTDFVVFTCVLDEECEQLRTLGFKEISQHSGGPNALQCGLWAAAFDEEDFGDIYKGLRDIKWESPESVQAFVKHENDDVFKKVNLKKGEKVISQNADTTNSGPNRKGTIPKSDGHPS